MTGYFKNLFGAIGRMWDRVTTVEEANTPPVPDAEYYVIHPNGDRTDCGGWHEAFALAGHVGGSAHAKANDNGQLDKLNDELREQCESAGEFTESGRWKGKEPVPQEFTPNKKCYRVPGPTAFAGRELLIRVITDVMCFGSNHYDNEWRDHCRGGESHSFFNGMEAISYTVACLLAQNTREGSSGVDWDIVYEDLVHSDWGDNREKFELVATKLVDEMDSPPILNDFDFASLELRLLAQYPGLANFKKDGELVKCPDIGYGLVRQDE